MSAPEDRWPALRGGLLGLVPLLAPFVWVVEVDSCGHAPRSSELTGVDVLTRMDADGWAVAAPVLGLVVLTPWLAARLAAPGWRLLVHVVGLIASAFALWGAGMVLLFTIFSQRTPRLAGLVYLAAFLGLVVDAVVRVTWSVQALLHARRPAPGPPP